MTDYITSEDDTHPLTDVSQPPTHCCYECGSEVYEDESPGVWLHTDTEYMSGRDIDADHVAIPDMED